MQTINILNLGAGVQSTALYLLSMDQSEPEVPKYDYAIFADTQEEPATVYKHLEWLQSLGGPPIIIVTAGRLGDALEKGSDANGNQRTDGGHYISIPAYTKHPTTGDRGIIRRQCTADFKVKPVEKEIRRIVGATPGRPVDKSITIVQSMGLSFDEPKRVIRVTQRFMGRPKNWQVMFPLWEMGWERSDCMAYLREKVPHEVPRSACVFCPFHSDAEWRWIKENDPEGWARSVEIDNICRTGQGLDAHRFLHKSCEPLELVDLQTRDEKTGQLKFGFIDECEGYCGN
jgi:hypothetical protein